MTLISTTLRPNSTLRAVNQVLHGSAATVDAAVADDDDTTWARSERPNSMAKVQFPGFDLPVGAVVNGVTIRLRQRALAETTVTTLLNGDSTGPFPFTPRVGTTFRTDSGSPQPNISVQAVAKGMTVQWNAGGAQTDVAEVYLDVEAIPRPVVTVLDPPGPVATSQPDVGWQFAGDYPQAQFQVKVFSQEQYDAPGFTPNDSAAFFDSGVQTGADDTFTVTTNLTNGLTYRFYARAAQVLPSTGDAQWSAWDFVQQPMSAPVPAVPTVVPTADNALARIKLTITDGFTPPPPTDGYGLGPYGLEPYGGDVAGGAGGFGGAGGAGTWQFVTVQRSSDGGLTWDPVRSGTRAQVLGPTFVLFDYEACNSVDVVYRAQAIGVAGAGDVASDWSAPTDALQWSSADTWLKSPTLPALNAIVRINSLPTLTHRQPAGSFDVEGRDDPVVVSDTRKLPNGTVTFLTLTSAERDAVEALLDRSEPLLLQTPPADDFGCRYLSIGDVDENRLVPKSKPKERLIICPFQVVLAPAGDIVGIGITWQTVLDRFATWNDLGSVGSWEALLELTT